MKDIELPPLPDLLEKAIVHFAQACLYSEAESRRASAEHLKSEVKAYARAAVDANSVPDGAISGALFDFAGFLTTLDVPVRFGSTEEASPMVGLLREFAKKRGLSLDNANVLNWSAMLSASPAPAHQIASVDTASLQCGCGDIFPAAQFNDGHCPNCWAGICAAQQEPAQQERKPMTPSQREAAFKLAEAAMEVDINLSWRNAIVEAVERHHGIKE